MSDSLNPTVTVTRDYEERKFIVLEEVVKAKKNPPEREKPEKSEPPAAPAHAAREQSADAEKQLAQLLKGFQF